MRRSFEGFLWWYVPLSLVSAIISGAGIPWATKSVMTGESGLWMLWLTMIARSLPALVTAVWLWKQPHRDLKIRVLWTAFGLTGSLWAVGLYLLVEAFSFAGTTGVSVAHADESATAGVTGDPDSEAREL